MSQTTTQQTPQMNVVLPEEQFWQCHSSRLELPLSTIFSISLHVLVIGLIICIPLLQMMVMGGERAYQPPKMDVVELVDNEGGGGVGGNGGFPGNGGKRTPGDDGKTEQVDNANKDFKDKKFDTSKKKLKNIENPKTVDVPKFPKTNQGTAEDKVFVELVSDAKQELAKALRVPVKQLATTGTTGRPGSPGTGGGRGGGEGTGIGSKKGPGTGTRPGGKRLTKSQKRELRWEVDFSGDAQAHLVKLQGLKVVLAIPTSQRGIFQIWDMSTRPHRARSFRNLVGYRDRVKWFNIHPPSVAKLARAIKIPYTPRFVVVFLPKSVEEEMARLEVDYRGLAEERIAFTRFEIRRRQNGSYGPVVVYQRPK